VLERVADGPGDLSEITSLLQRPDLYALPLVQLRGSKSRCSGPDRRGQVAVCRACATKPARLVWSMERSRSSRRKADRRADPVARSLRWCPTGSSAKVSTSASWTCYIVEMHALYVVEMAFLGDKLPRAVLAGQETQASARCTLRALALAHNISSRDLHAGATLASR
jgi:hypothetical protein